MINERAHLIRRKDHHQQFDRFDPNPNANFFLKHHGFINWADAAEPPPALPLQPQFLQQKDWVFALATSSFSPSSSSSSSSSSAPAEAREGPRFRPRVCEDHPTTTTAAAAALGAMRDLPNRTKVVVRHLPPALSESAFREQIELRFAGSFNLVTFSPGKSSVKGSTYSRAYIDFKHVEDVIEFHQEFNGHIFVNEKGTQYKALVEYAPHQRVAKLWSKKDTREGLILQDPEYLKFVEMLAKPVEYLPSAEVQLERKEAERSLNLASGVKEGIVITPLMEFVRQKRALKSMPQKSLAAAGKISVRGGGSSPSISSKMLQKRGDRSRTNSMYITGARPKEKATYVPRCEENQRRDVLLDKKGRLLLEIKDKKIPQEAHSGKVILSNQSIHSNKLVIDKNGIDQPGIKGLVAGKKVVSEIEKEEFFDGGVSGSPGLMNDSMSGALIPRNHGITSMKNPVGSFPSQHGFTFSGGEDSLLSKPSQRVEGGGRLSRGASSSRTPLLLQKSDQQSDKDKRLPRSQIWRSNAKESNAVPISTTLVLELESSSSQQHHYASTSFTDDRSETSRQEGRRVRNKDRPDRPVWTVRRRGDVSTSLESPRSFAVGSPLSPPGSQRQVRGPREFDSNVTPDASKPANKRVGGSSTIYGSHEKQVWVAKPGSGS